MIRVVGLTKTFGARTVLDALSLEIQPGKVTYLLGKSGVGKSVLLRHLVGLLRPEVGEVFVDELSVHDRSESELAEVRRRCGMVFQFPALLDSLTVAENLEFALSARRLEVGSRVQDVLARVHLGQEILSRYPPELSFGVQKRVAIARLLVLSPKYLLFDEPTTGLDPQTASTVDALVRELVDSSGVGALVVSHDMESALAIADRILVIEAGKILADETPQGIAESPEPLVRAFFNEAVGRE